MDIKKQKQLITRIQSDLRKEAHKHTHDGNSMAAVDCAEQANSLDYVLATLTHVNMLIDGMTALGLCFKTEEKRDE